MLAFFLDEALPGLDLAGAVLPGCTFVCLPLFAHTWL